MRVYQKKEWAVLKKMLEDTGFDKITPYYVDVYNAVADFVKDWNYRRLENYIPRYFHVSERERHMKWFFKMMEMPYEDLPLYMHEHLAVWRIKIGR